MILKEVWSLVKSLFRRKYKGNGVRKLVLKEMWSLMKGLLGGKCDENIPYHAIPTAFSWVTLEVCCDKQMFYQVKVIMPLMFTACKLHFFHYFTTES